MTLIKRLLFLAIVFFGLYYFGDFRVNDVNVRDYLHQKVTSENIESAKVFAMRIFYGAKDLFQSFQSEQNRKDQRPTDSHQKIDASVNLDALKKPLESLSEQDRKKLLELLEKTNGKEGSGK
jgi:hypothetical protein